MDMNNGHDQYGLPDLRQLLAARTQFPVTSQPSETFLFHHNMAAATAQPQYEHTIVVGTEFMPSEFIGYDSSAINNVTTTTITTTSKRATSASAMDIDRGIWPTIANDGGNSRWPRQETLTLLEIRSLLDSKFKEANQKGPLWDQVSRIMAEEHGYQRSGKKCKEKFENLYKYYKKTKEGKAGRHDGKHYRFFRQLEAICGEPSNNNNQTTVCANATQPSISNIVKQETQDDLKLYESTLSLSVSSESDTLSSENIEDELSSIAFMVKQSMESKISREEGKHKRGKKSWKAKVKEFVDSQMRKIIDSQDAWMEKTMKAIEDKEQERIHKEEEWRKQEEAKFNREHELWARKRAWLEARDASLMEVLKKYTCKGFQLLSSTEPMQENMSKEICINNTVESSRWTEPEFSTLLQLRACMDLKYHEKEYMKEGFWEDVSARMRSLGYDRSACECRDKWENKGIRFNDKGVASSSQVNQNNSFQQIMMNGEVHWWRNCGLSLNKEKNQHG